MKPLWRCPESGRAAATFGHRLRLAVTLLLGLSLAACARPEIYQQQSYVFGTLVEVSIYGEPADRARAQVDQVFRDFDFLHHSLHAWHPGTLSRTNAIFAASPARAAVAPSMIPILQETTLYYQMSDGLFNPAIGKLIRLWGFQSDEFKPVRPDPAKIAQLVKADPKMTDIVLDGIDVYSRNPAVQLDLGGFAKGYALDLESAFLRSQGVKSALLNIGGNIMAIGQHGDRPWRVGIQDPRKPGPIATLDLRDGESVGTSGDYQRYFILDGKRYCHIIDPRTGYPAQGVQSVTIVVPPGPHAGALSDAASKPLFIAGVAHWREAARKMGITDAMLVDDQGRIYLTPGMAKRIHFTEKGRQIEIVP